MHENFQCARPLAHGAKSRPARIIDACAQPHQGEVFAVYDLAGAWPGDDAVARQAEQGCQDRFDKYTSSTDSDIQLFYLQPVKSSWSVDRGVTCIATKSGTPLTGTLPK